MDEFNHGSSGQCFLLQSIVSHYPNVVPYYYSQNSGSTWRVPAFGL